MKIINKPVSLLYPDATIIFKSYDLGVIFNYRKLYLTIIFLFFLIYIIIANGTHHLLLTSIIIYVCCTFIFWNEYSIEKVYITNDILIFNIFKNWSVIITVTDISYILLRGCKYESNQLQVLKLNLYSSYPGIIFQIGLFRFILRDTNNKLYMSCDPTFTNLLNNFFVDLNLNDKSFKIINNYDFLFNWKHQTIEMKLYLNRFICMITYIFIKPIAMILKK